MTTKMSEDLRQAIERAFALWPDRATWLKLMKNGMSADWSWERSARDYARVYAEIARRVANRESSPDSSES